MRLLRLICVCCAFYSILEFQTELETQVCVLHSDKSDGNPGQHKSKSRPEGASFDMNLCCFPIERLDLAKVKHLWAFVDGNLNVL